MGAPRTRSHAAPLSVMLLLSIGHDEAGSFRASKKVRDGVGRGRDGGEGWRRHRAVLFGAAWSSNALARCTHAIAHIREQRVALTR
jgi:hypothetical protein